MHLSGASSPLVLNTNAARTKPQETRREVVCANGSVVFAPAVLLSARFADHSIQQWSPTCLLIATNLPTPEG